MTVFVPPQGLQANSDARPEVLPIGIDAAGAADDQRVRGWIKIRLPSVSFRCRSGDVISQTQIQREIRLQFPIVLDKDSSFMPAASHHESIELVGVDGACRQPEQQACDRQSQWRY